ncbi:MAG: hypothetical protein F4Z31_20570 [Gemmatimonadetes bacterium]|nr:hypothetical protein [Gemmatimonadota bacterium]MYA44131.1 hypothetical protein [Gemmatimonadota bacterium]MYJ09386.1 hypothetical protein [Gemmatimonadota bacterium]
MNLPASRPFIGVEPFDVSHGAGFRADEEDEHTVECRVVEDGGHFRIHRPTNAGPPVHLGFVDGVRRTEAHLTHTGADGETITGLAGAWGAGAVLIGPDGPAAIRHAEIGRAVIFSGGQQVRLRPHPGGWRWLSLSVDSEESHAASQHLQRLMRDTEADIADRLVAEGWLVVFDGPLHGIRHSRTAPVVGYVKTHHRRTLAVEHWQIVPRLAVGERTSLFVMMDERYACYIRVGDAGPWAGPWAGIVRLEVPASSGNDQAVATVDRAARWLPAFASAPHRNARAPVNLTPVAALEEHLHHMLGDSRLALRAVREAVMQHNRDEEAA